MHRTRSGFLTLAAAVGMLLGASVAVTPATAAIVTFSFTGVTGSSDFPVNPPITLPGTVQGTFTFNNISGAVSAFNLNNFNSVPSLVYNTHLTGGVSGVAVTDNVPAGVNFRDRWELSAAATGAALGAFTPNRFEIQLDQENPSPTLFSSNTVQNPPSLGLLTSTHWRILFNDNNNGVAVVAGSLTSLTAVPLPPAVILFGAGLVALIGLGARNWQRAQGVRLAA